MHDFILLVKYVLSSCYLVHQLRICKLVASNYGFEFLSSLWITMTFYEWVRFVRSIIITHIKTSNYYLLHALQKIVITLIRSCINKPSFNHSKYNASIIKMIIIKRSVTEPYSVSYKIYVHWNNSMFILRSPSRISCHDSQIFYTSQVLQSYKSVSIINCYIKKV